MTTFFIVVGIFLAAIILIYVLARLITGVSVFISHPTPRPGIIEADQYYYLPFYSMTVTATARIKVEKNADNQITRASLLQVSFDLQTKVEPDTTQLIELKYNGDWFSNDEVRINTSAESMLQSVSSATEDRISQIISTIAGAGKELIAEKKELAIEREAAPAGKTEMLETSKTFSISGKRILKREINQPWLITLNEEFAGEPQPVNASFTMKTDKLPVTILGNEFKGILTRPMTNQEWEINVNGLAESSSFTCFVPDISSVVVTPVRRSYFTKRQQLPKLSNGVLIENFINKSSEWEAFASIPINIGKALVSIPAQLLQFKIIRIQQETEFEKATAALTKAKEENTTAKLDQLKEELKKVQGDVGKAQPLQGGGDDKKEGEPIPPLGKLPPEGKQPTQSIDDIIRESFKQDDAKELLEIAPAIETPEERFWDTAFQGDWLDYGNKPGGINNCVPAAAAHMVMCWTSIAKNTTTKLEPADVSGVFTSGCTPEGCKTSNFLTSWRKKGIGTNKIVISAPIRKQKREDMKQAIARFGACMVGFNMPATAQSQNDHWKIVPTADPKLSAPGSWGGSHSGHAVAAIGYDKDIMLVISWGRKIKVSWDFYEMYNDESYVVLSNDWKKDETNTASDHAFVDLKKIIDILNA